MRLIRRSNRSPRSSSPNLRRQGRQAPQRSQFLTAPKTVSNWVAEREAHQVEVGGRILESVHGEARSVRSSSDLSLAPNSRRPCSQSSVRRGNSGVFLMGQYEIQVLIPTITSPIRTDSAALYGRAKPLNASRGPGEWQLTRTFHRPIFDDEARLREGQVSRRAQRTPFMTTMNSAVEPVGVARIPFPNTKSMDKGPLKMQDHGNPVRFRNIGLSSRTKLSPDLMSSSFFPSIFPLFNLGSSPLSSRTCLDLRNGGGHSIVARFG